MSANSRQARYLNTINYVESVGNYTTFPDKTNKVAARPLLTNEVYGRQFDIPDRV